MSNESGGTGKGLILEELTEQIIGAAIEVHKTVGPGLMESAYEKCLCRELQLRVLQFERQVPVPIEYKGMKLQGTYYIDILVERSVVLELKAVAAITEIHEAQLLTYLKLTGHRVGFIFNFNVVALKRGGIVRRVL